MFKRYTITCALPYANGPLHIGQIAGAHLPGDIFYRFLKLRGFEAIHICGTDDHGVANIIAAQRKGISPAQNTSFYHKEFTRTLDKWAIIYDNFSQTQRPVHHKTAQAFFLRLHEKGYLYKKELEQLYCPKCERFLPERYVQGTCPHCGFTQARGDQCEKCGRWLEPTQLIDPKCSVCGTRPELRKTWHYYFKLSQLSDRLKSWLESKTHWKPNVKNTALAWIREGLEDRPITRDLDWGVPVPLEEAKGKVLYVWFDAPIGYISATKELLPQDWEKWWKDPETGIIHFIGKDNIVFHALIWPGMLMAHGEFQTPDNVPANEFLNLMGEKLSTSRNWAVWAEEFVDTFGTDYARFGASVFMPENKDSDFDYYGFMKKVNNDLVNTYGNLVHRVFSFIERFYQGEVPQGNTVPEAADKIKEHHQDITRALERYEFRKALASVHRLAGFANEFFTTRAPWEARKENPSHAQDTLYSCVQIIRTLTVLYEPFVPVSSQKIRDMLGLGRLTWDQVKEPDPSLAGVKLRNVAPVFEKIEKHTIDQQVAKLGAGPEKTEKEEKQTETVQTINIEQFKRLRLQVAKVISARKHPNADKLLLLEIDLGNEKRQLVAGLARRYQPEELVGKSIVVLANLEPAKIRGQESQGMLLAATDPEGEPVILVPEKPVPPGSEVR